jgi:hypothetical protein
MTIRHASSTGIRSPRLRAATLPALGAVSLGLLAAAPAGAAQNDKPLDPNGKPMCGKTTSDGETRWYRQGERIREIALDGTATTKKCGEKGEWVVVTIRGSRSPDGAGVVAGAHAGAASAAAGPRTPASATTIASSLSMP